MKNKNPREVSPVEVFFRFVDGRLKATIIWYLAQGMSLIQISDNTITYNNTNSDISFKKKS